MKYIAPPLAPNVLSNDPAKPYNGSGPQRNLVRNFRLLGIIPWLQECELDQVVEMWWYAKGIQAERTP